MSELPRRQIALGLLAFALLTPPLAHAARTQLHSVADFEKLADGDPDNTGVASQGAVTLAPALQSVGALSGGPLLALTCDGRDTCYAAVGAPARVIAVESNGKSRTVLEAEEPVVTALALDGKGALFAATSPEGKVLRIDPRTGKSQTWFSPEAKHIWALAHDGNALYVATGDPGALYRVTAQGKATRIGEKALAEKLLRSLAVLPGNKGIIVGGGRKGGLYQVDGNGSVFSLHDSSLEEVTDIAVASDGTIVASLVAQDAKGEGEAELLKASDAGGDDDGNAQDARASEVVVVFPSGDARRIWRGKKDAAYAVAFDDRGGVLIGTGGRGRIYRVDLQRRDISILSRMPSNRVTALERTRRGVLVGMSHATRLALLQNGLAREGTYLSPVFDAERTAQMGRLEARGELPAGTRLSFQLRTGNTEKPDDTWSAWSPSVPFPGGALSAPRARFAQLKATLNGDGKATPELRELHMTWRAPNNPPVVKDVSVLAPGVRVERMPDDEPKGRTFTVNARAFEDFAQKPLQSPAPPEPAARAKQTFEDGWRTVTWHATDDDDDDLRYTAELLDDSGTRLWVLGEELRDPFIAFNEARVPDGLYRVRVTADDVETNPVQERATADKLSSTFTVDRTAPQLKGSIKGSVVTLVVEDLSPIIRTECSVDGGVPLRGQPADGMLDGPKEEVAIQLPTLPRGRHVIACRAEDAMGNLGRLVLDTPAR